MSLVKLKEYQQEALEEVQNGVIAGLNSQLIVLPTGSGKTILMAAIGQSFNKKLLLLDNREGLIQQAVEKFKLYWPEADIGICKAERDEISHQIVIGSVQSCSRQKRLDRLKEQEFDILMIDEAHHSKAKICFKKGWDKHNEHGKDEAIREISRIKQSEQVRCG